MSAVNINKENLQREVLEAQQDVLLDFWAPWCGPCRMIAPFLEEIAAEDESVTIGKVNVDEEPQLAAKFGVVSIPTLVVMDGGAIVAQAVGARPKEMILEMLNFD